MQHLRRIFAVEPFVLRVAADRFAQCNLPSLQLVWLLQQLRTGLIDAMLLEELRACVAFMHDSKAMSLEPTEKQA
eukprot:3613068-Amphidinium_carterae.1